MITQLSVIIPTYNSATTIFKCISTIINQTFRNYEILIIDGLSKDDTIPIIRSFNDERIKIHSEADQGVYDAMNKGIKMATGEWVFILGSDDCLYNNDVLQNFFDEIVGVEVDVVYGNVVSPRFNGLYGGEFDEERILRENICHQSIFFRKHIFKKIGLFKTRFKALADWDHNIKWFCSKKITHKYIDLIIAHYSDGGLSSVINDSCFESERGIRYLIYGSGGLPLKQKIGYFKAIFIAAINQKKFDRAFFLLVNFGKILNNRK
jgi:glycosyltransferase involved in cell wall biosynthesis